MRRVLRDEVTRVDKQTSSQHSSSETLRCCDGLDRLRQVLDRLRQVLDSLRPVLDRLHPHRQSRKGVVAALVVCFSWRQEKHWECTWQYKLLSLIESHASMWLLYFQNLWGAVRREYYRTKCVPRLRAPFRYPIRDEFVFLTVTSWLACKCWWMITWWYIFWLIWWRSEKLTARLASYPGNSLHN